MEPDLDHQFLVHSSLYAVLSGRLVWSVIKNEVILIINGTILPASLLPFQTFWLLCLKSLLKIMVFHMSLGNFQTHCTYFVHSRCERLECQVFASKFAWAYLARCKRPVAADHSANQAPPKPTGEDYYQARPKPTLVWARLAARQGPFFGV